MRYENWDVLLFPDSSKVPIQEFKTQCFVIKDRESPYLQSPAIINPTAYYLPQGNLGQLPVLTTFIPSLPHNALFRVSIHSWQKPRPSRLMDSLMQPDDALLFEIRVFVDGLCVSGSVFSQRTNWPHIIDLSSHIDKNGNQDNLRFPPFHQEILEQKYWDAEELHGRIRIVMAEGFARPHRNPPFERVKDIIAFSFQHAPLYILEYSNIAWPNAGMWSQAPRLFKYNSGSGLSDPKEQEDAHAHSPTRHENRGAVATSSHVSNPPVYNTWSYRNYQAPPPSQWQSNHRDPRWAASQEPFMPDPFIDPYILDPARHRGARPSWEDVPMPDYISSSSSSRAISSMTGISYEHSKQPSIVAPIDEESYSQFIEALSPPKPLVCGTQAPTNTPSAVIPMATKLSAAAEARSASYSKSGCRPSILKEISQPETREVSGSSAKSTLPPEAMIEKLHVSPTGLVKSRKEGMAPDNKENEASVETPRRESDKVNHTPTRMILRTSGNVETPTESKRHRSATGSTRGDASLVSKEDVVIPSPSIDLSEAGDHIQQAGFEDFLDSRIELVGSTVDGADID